MRETLVFTLVGVAVGLSLGGVYLANPWLLWGALGAALAGMLLYYLLVQ